MTRRVTRKALHLSLVIHSIALLKKHRVNPLVVSIMSINDKVHVIWKTNCEWHDYSHWPKRKDIKFKNESKNEGRRYPALNPGDVILVKFGTKWYDAEVKDKWEPKSYKSE